MSSSRPFPKNIYSSKRRQRSISNPHGRPPQSSSPLKVLSTEDEDITVTEMSLRMKKRSRSGMKRLLTGGGDAPKAASVGTSPAERADARPNKKSKIQRTPLAELDRRDSNIQSAFLEDRTQDMDLTNCAEIKTPAAREAVPKPPKLKAPADDLDASEKDEESDFLSPLPFSKFAKRVIAHRSSSSLREASQKSSGLAGSLASPFNSRPGSPGHLNLKAIRDKTINRTRSVQNDLRRRAALRSFSRAESPSSNASSPGIQKSSESWSVPDHIKQSISQKTPRRPSATGVLPNSDTSFSFSPIACSTPIKNQNSRLDINATPRFPSFDLSFHSEDDMALDDPTPRASAISESLLAQKPDMILFPNVQERISSAETNKSRSSRRVLVSESLTIAPPVSPTSGMVSPMTSDGDELRDMFSILGLDEDEAWHQSSTHRSMAAAGRLSTGKRPPRGIINTNNKKKRSSLSARDDRLDKASSALKRSSKPIRKVSIEMPVSSASRAGRAPPRKTKNRKRERERAMSPQLGSVQGANVPSLRMRILDSPIVPDSDSSDELLLK